MMKRRLLQACTAALLGAALVGCGAGGRKPGNLASAATGGALSPLASMAPAALSGGPKGVRFGQGGQGAEAPAIAKAADGTWVLAFVGTQSGDRKVFISTSSDGQSWSAATPLPGTRAYSDQAPSLAVDAKGQLHLGFLSNRQDNDWALYHSVWAAGAFGVAQRVEGFSGAMDLAIAYHGEKLVVAAELRGVGLVVSEGQPDAGFEEAELVTEQGFEPALAQGPDGQLALAYRRGDSVLAQVGVPGAWSAASPLAGGDGVKRREPSLAWGASALVAAWAEAGAMKAVRLEAEGLKASEGPVWAPVAGAEARQPALAWMADGKLLAAWGLSQSAQFGVATTVISP